MVTDKNFDWRCRACGRLLGVVKCGRLEIRSARGHHYQTALPATCTCRNCNTYNQLSPDLIRPHFDSAVAVA